MTWLIVHDFYNNNNNAIVITPNDANFTLTQLREEVKIRYPLPYDRFTICRDGNTIVMEFMGEFNAFEWIERPRIHILAGLTNLEDLNHPMIGCTCQYDCPGSAVSVQIRVEPATFEWSTRKWSFQYAHASVLYEPILKLANGYFQWLWELEDPVWRTMLRRSM